MAGSTRFCFFFQPFVLVVSLIAGVYFSLALWPDLFRFYSWKILLSLKMKRGGDLFNVKTKKHIDPTIN